MLLLRRLDRVLGGRVAGGDGAPSAGGDRSVVVSDGEDELALGRGALLRRGVRLSLRLLRSVLLLRCLDRVLGDRVAFLRFCIFRWKVLLALVGRDVLRFYSRARCRVRDLSISRGRVAVDLVQLHRVLVPDVRPSDYACGTGETCLKKTHVCNPIQIFKFVLKKTKNTG